MSDEHLGRYVQILDSLIKRERLSQNEVERRLGWSKGSLSRLLSGKRGLEIRHLLQVLEVIKVTPQEFYGLVHPPVAPASLASAVMVEIAGDGGSLPPMVLPPRLTAEELDVRIEEALRRVFAEQAKVPPARS